MRLPTSRGVPFFVVKTSSDSCHSEPIFNPPRSALTYEPI